MKKIILFAAFALVGSTFTSCKKDYTCTCVTKVTGYPDQTTTLTIKDVSKSDAKKSCDASASSTSGGTTGSITCSL